MLVTGIKWVKLTRKGGGQFWIHGANLTRIEPNERGSLLTFGQGDHELVSENPDEILKLIG